MANFNQTPSGQASIDLVLPSLAFGVNGTGTWNQPNYAWGGGSSVTLALPSMAFVASGTGTRDAPNFAWGGGSSVNLTLGETGGGGGGGDTVRVYSRPLDGRLVPFQLPEV